MNGKLPRYSEEFKEATVRLIRTTGRSPVEVAAELGVSDRQVRRWLRGEFVSGPPRLALSVAERAELKRLRREVQVLRQEQEILRKASAFFAKETR